MFFCENRIWEVFTNSLDDNPLFLQCNKFLCYKIEKYLDLKYALKFIIFVSDIYELFFGGKNEDFFLFLLAVVAVILAWRFYPVNSWDKTFPKSDNVTVKKVKFKNRYGIELVGDLYIPKK